jgi:DNA invertase Pin-like site-specific DNA recombinase
LRIVACAPDWVRRRFPDHKLERHLVVICTGEGRKRAMDHGVLFGRPPKLTPHQTREAIARRGNGETLTSIARSFNVSHSTISRL